MSFGTFELLDDVRLEPISAPNESAIHRKYSDRLWLEPVTRRAKLAITTKPLTRS